MLNKEIFGSFGGITFQSQVLIFGDTAGREYRTQQGYDLLDSVRIAFQLERR
jgi:hypothetical protein